MRGPYTIQEKVTARAPEDSIFTVHGGDGGIICECYGLVAAKKITIMLNLGWIHELRNPSNIGISLAGVLLSGRAAKTAKAKTGGTHKRRAAKRDKGTAEARAVAGSIPAPGFRGKRNANGAKRG